MKKQEESAEEQEIRLFIQQIQKRLVWQRMLTLLTLYGAGGALFCLFCNLVFLWVPVYAGVWIAFGGFLFLLFLSLVHLLLRLPKEYEAAVAGDQAGLEERLATSLERRGKSDLMSELQRKDTLEKIHDFSIPERIVLKLYPKRYVGISLCLLLAFLCALLPTPAKQLAKERHELALLQKEVVKRIDKAEKSIKKQAGEGKLSEGDKKKLDDVLKAVKKEVQGSKSEEDIRKAKERLETKLVKSLPEQMSKELADNLQSLVPNQDLEAAAEFGQQLTKLAGQSQTVAEAKEALQNLGQMLSAEQKQALMEQLNQAAADGEVTEQELSQALESLNDANASYTQMQLAQSSSEQSSGSQEAGGNGQASSSASSQPGSQSTPGTQGQQNGNGSGQGDGSGSGSGSGQGSGSGSGSGSGQGSGSGSGSSFGQGSGSGNGSGYSSGSETGIERADKAGKAEQVWVPEREGDDENLTGRKTGDSKNQKKSQTAKTTNAGKKADLAAVSGSYEQKAYSKIKKQKIPDSMENLVKEYFSSLD